MSSGTVGAASAALSGLAMSESEIDTVLLALLGDELLGLMLRPPPVPAFARETIRPARSQ